MTFCHMCMTCDMYTKNYKTLLREIKELSRELSCVCGVHSKLVHTDLPHSFLLCGWTMAYIDAYLLFSKYFAIIDNFTITLYICCCVCWNCVLMQIPTGFVQSYSYLVLLNVAKFPSIGVTQSYTPTRNVRMPVAPQP